MSDETIERVTELMIAGVMAQDVETHDRCLGEAVRLLEASEDAHSATVDTLVGTAQYAAFATVMLARVYQKEGTWIVRQIQRVLRDGGDSGDD